MKRELRTRELQLLDKSRMRFVDHQQTMKKIEIKRLEEELRRKVCRGFCIFNFGHFCYQLSIMVVASRHNITIIVWFISYFLENLLLVYV